MQRTQCCHHDNVMKLIGLLEVVSICHCVHFVCDIRPSLIWLPTYPEKYDEYGRVWISRGSLFQVSLLFFEIMTHDIPCAHSYSLGDSQVLVKVQDMQCQCGLRDTSFLVLILLLLLNYDRGY